jgi:hypothetical protein
VPALVGEEAAPEAEAAAGALISTVAAGEGLSAGEGFALLALEASSDGADGFISTLSFSFTFSASGVAGSAVEGPAPVCRSGVEGVFLPMPNMPKRRPPEPVAVLGAAAAAATGCSSCCFCSGVDVVVATGPATGFVEGVVSVSTFAALFSSLIISVCAPV